MHRRDAEDAEIISLRFVSQVAPKWSAPGLLNGRRPLFNNAPAY